MALLNFACLFGETRRYSIIGSAGDCWLVVCLAWRYSQVGSHRIVVDLAAGNPMVRSCSSILDRLILSRFHLSWLSKTTSDTSAYATCSSSNTTCNTTSYSASNTTANRWLCSLLDHRPGGDVRPQVKTLHFDLLRAQINLIHFITVVVDFSKIWETSSYLRSCSLSIFWTGSLFVTHASTSAKPTLLACNILSSVLLTE